MIEKLLSRLSKVKRTGPDRYIACCPAHDDRTPSMGISQKDGNIIFHCFAGCEPADILESVGLTFADLYPERPNHKKMSFNAYDVLKCVSKEVFIIELAAHMMINDGSISLENLGRLQIAHDRINDAIKMAGLRS